MIEEAITVMFDDELDEFIEELERLSEMAHRERVRRRLKNDQRPKDRRDHG
jgi:hypothetical protein